MIVLTANDLITNSAALQAVSPVAKLAVFGDPVAHSKSPAMQNAALRAMGVDGSYVAVHVESHELEAALRALPERGFLGANLTIPHKAAAFGMIDEIDGSARELGVVNTILVDDGRLRGFNTDGPGLVRAIRDQFSVDIKDLRILLFGAGGGAGRAIAIQCAMENCERLVLVNRTFEKAVALGLAGIFGVVAGEVAVVLWLDLAAFVFAHIGAGFDPLGAEGGKALGDIAIEILVAPQTRGVIDADWLVFFQRAVEAFGR
jgi:shikimate 5-dehydrogenase